MKKIPLFGLVLFLAGNLYAGKATFIGIGSSKPRPQEFATINIEVQSECFPTAVKARKENNEKVREIQNFLMKLIRKDFETDRLDSSGGKNGPFERRSYSASGDKISCENTFYQNTTIIFKTGDLINLAENFADMQDSILPLASEKSRTDLDSPVTWIKIGSPVPGICEKTRKEMVNEAITAAEENAVAQLKAHCLIVEPIKLEKSKPAEESGFSTSYAKSVTLESVSSEIVDITFAPAVEHVRRKITFSFRSPDICIADK